MDAMAYEFLIRRVYQCGRNGIEGADADIYRKMEHAESHLNDPHWRKTKEEKEYDYRSAFVEVKNHVANAIKKGSEKVKFKLSKEEESHLYRMLNTVRRIDFYNKEELDEIIDKADEIFSKQGLQPH